MSESIESGYSRRTQGLSYLIIMSYGIYLIANIDYISQSSQIDILITHGVGIVMAILLFVMVTFDVRLK